MTTAAIASADLSSPHRLAGGFRASWKTILLIAAINTAIAAAMWIEDPRPWWHPVISAQCMGFVIAWCVNVVKPWEHDNGLRRLVPAVAVGTLLGTLLIIGVKQYSLAFITDNLKLFGATLLSGFTSGFFISLVFHTRFRDTRIVAALGRAETERVRLQKQAVEAELKLLQAQVEPHFLFNTLASIDHLIETDPPRASQMQKNLIALLRASMPTMRETRSNGAPRDLAREMAVIRPYLEILKVRMEERLQVRIDVPDGLLSAEFPPMMIQSLVENAIKHGLEPKAEGGEIAIRCEIVHGKLNVVVADTGLGFGKAATAGTGVGLANIRERLQLLYGGEASVAVSENKPSGTVVTIAVPYRTVAAGSAA
jgi:signal transduction histidine kinase